MTIAKNCILPPEFPLLEFTVPFDDLIGLEYIKIGADSCEAVINFQQKHWQPTGIVHGGVYCSIAESVASVSAFAWLFSQDLGEGYAVGVNNNTDFLRATSSGTARAVSTPIHRGRRQQLWLVEITDEEERLLANGQIRLQNIFPTH